MAHKELIERAIEIAGGQAALGREIGRTQQGISYLLTRARRVSGETAVAIHRATKGEISKEALRPDLFRGEMA